MKFKIGDIVVFKKTENITLISSLSGKEGTIIQINPENEYHEEYYHIKFKDREIVYNIPSQFLILYSPSRRDIRI